MAELIAERCVACRPDAPHVTDQEIAGLHPQIPHWQLIDEAGIRKLDRQFKLKNFARALSFTNKIGQIAEEEGHHPRLVTEWGRVTVTWWSHELRGLHRNDFVMAAKTDRLFEALRTGAQAVATTPTRIDVP